LFCFSLGAGLDKDAGLQKVENSALIVPDDIGGFGDGGGDGCQEAINMGNSEESVRCVGTLVDVEGARVAEFEMPSGTQGASHYHSSLSEHCVRLQGKIDVKVGGSSARSLQPGDRVKIDPGVVHQISSPGPDPGRYLVVQHGGTHDFVEV